MMEHPKIRVIVADDHFIVRQGLRAVLASTTDIEVLIDVRTGKEAVEAFERLRPDVAIIDVRMPEMDGPTATRAILAIDPNARVIAISHYEGDEDIFQCISAGAWNYLMKRTLEDELPDMVRAAYQGQKLWSREVGERLALRASRPLLTERQHEVLQLIGEGLSNKEIATKLSLSTHTVNTYVATILTKLGVAQRTQAVSVALARGLIRR